MSVTSRVIILYILLWEPFAIQLLPAKAFYSSSRGDDNAIFLKCLKIDRKHCSKYSALVTRNALNPTEDPVGQLLWKLSQTPKWLFGSNWPLSTLRCLFPHNVSWNWGYFSWCQVNSVDVWNSPVTIFAIFASASQAGCCYNWFLIAIKVLPPGPQIPFVPRTWVGSSES